MRKLFWLLLLANVLLFAAVRQGWMVSGDQEPQAQPALNPGGIRLLNSAQNAVAIPAAAVHAAAVHAVAPASAPAAAPAHPHQAAPVQQPVAAAPQAEPACIEWGDFSGPDLIRVTEALAGLKLGDRLSQRQVERDAGYWVYIPPQKNKAAVKRKVAELKALGIGEYFVVQAGGRWHDAISLGVFKTQDGAQNYLNYLHTKGVHTAKVGARASKFKATVFSLNGIDAATAAKLAAMQKDFAGSELKRVACAH